MTQTNLPPYLYPPVAKRSCLKTECKLARIGVLFRHFGSSRPSLRVLLYVWCPDLERAVAHIGTTGEKGKRTNPAASLGSAPLAICKTLGIADI